jgi:hypothetical protein
LEHPVIVNAISPIMGIIINFIFPSALFSLR